MSVKRHIFIERTLFLLRKKLENQLPEEDILDIMIEKAKKIMDKIYK